MPEELQPADLDAFERDNAERLRLEAAASPGPWVVRPGRYGPATLVCAGDGGESLIASCEIDANDGPREEADAAFCAHARNAPAGPAVAALLAEARRLRALEAVVREYEPRLMAAEPDPEDASNLFLALSEWVEENGGTRQEH